MNRRHFLMGSAATAFAAKKKNPARPNIVLILADDLGAWMTGAYGNKEIKTPNIDMLARSGMRFINSSVYTPMSSPSRATIFTGRVPRQHGIVDFLTDQPVENPPQGQTAAPASFAQEVMISDVLAGGGYNCGYVGKWQLGNDADPKHGLGYAYTLKAGTHSYQNPEMFLNGKPVQEQGYLTELTTRRAGEFIDQQSTGKPFFLTIGYLNAHTPYDGHPQKYYDLYADTKFDTIGYDDPAKNALPAKGRLK